MFSVCLPEGKTISVQCRWDPADTGQHRANQTQRLGDSPQYPGLGHPNLNKKVIGFMGGKKNVLVLGGSSYLVSDL